jgi:hypothetical protein
MLIAVPKIRKFREGKRFKDGPEFHDQVRIRLRNVVFIQRIPKTTFQEELFRFSRNNLVPGIFLFHLPIFQKSYLGIGDFRQ